MKGEREREFERRNSVGRRGHAWVEREKEGLVEREGSREGETQRKSWSRVGDERSLFLSLAVLG